MRKVIIVFLTLILNFCTSPKEPQNCSTFVLNTSQELFVGHNLDESPELHVPGYVCINPRNVYREGITWSELTASPSEYEKVLVPFEEKTGPKISWISKYGSVTFNSEGLDFPDGGINEKGISIFEMSLGGTRHKYNKSNPTLFMVLWIQYVLDNCSTLEEVIQSANTINLDGWSWHYFVSDKEGNYAIIEFLKGEVIVFRNDEAPYPVLCNTSYSQELERMKDYEDNGGIWHQLKSWLKKPPRFTRAVNMLNKFDESFNKSAKDYALEILDEIKISGWNKWALLVDVKNMKIYFHTNKNRKVRYFSLTDFDFTHENPRLLNIHEDLSGQVSENFSTYTYQLNYSLTKERADLLFAKRLNGLTENGVNAEIYAKRFADYPERIRGRKKE